jgi:hypothetical protein
MEIWQLPVEVRIAAAQERLLKQLGKTGSASSSQQA